MLLPLASLPMRGEWIEIVNMQIAVIFVKSLPMRGEWIEINEKLCNI